MNEEAMGASGESRAGEPLNIKPVIRSDRQAAITWAFPTPGPHRSAVLLERSVDGGQWVQIAQLGGTVINYTDNGLAADHRYQYRVRTRGSAGYTPYTTSGYHYTTPAAPATVSVSRTGATTATVDITGAARWPEAYIVQTSPNGSRWSTGVEVPGFPADVEVPAGGAVVRVAARRISKTSAWTRSSETTGPVTAPLPPTLGPVRGSFAIPADVPVTWAPNHPDGSLQREAQVELTGPTGGTTVTTVSGAEPSATVRVTSEGMHQVRVRTKGISPEWGSWSAKAAFRASTAPNAYFTAPAIDGTAVTSIPFTLEWGVDTPAGVVSQTVTVRAADGTALHTAIVPPSLRSYTLSSETYIPPSGGRYTAEIDAVDGTSLRTHGERLFSADYAEPASPYCTVTYGDGETSASVTVRRAASSWEVSGDGMLVSPGYWSGSGGRIPLGASTFGPEGGVLGIGAVIATEKVSVSRVDADGVTPIERDLMDGGTAMDRLPPLNTPFEYVVTAYGENGSAIETRVPALVECEGEAFNFGGDASTEVVLVLDASSDSSLSHGGEEFHFALGPDTPALPEFYADGTTSATGSKSYAVIDLPSYRRVDEIRRDPANAVCWYRDHWGGRHRVRAEFSLGYASSSYSLWTVGASLTELMWRNPSNG